MLRPIERCRRPSGSEISPSTACKPRYLELRRAVHLANVATLALLFTRRPLHLAIFRTLMMGVDQRMAEKTAEIEESALARLLIPDAVMPGQYYEGVRRDDPGTGAVKRLMWRYWKTH
jgi:hypothetical protein